MDLLIPLFADYPHLNNKDLRLDVLCTLQELLLGHKECGDQRYASKVGSASNLLLRLCVRLISC